MKLSIAITALASSALVGAKYVPGAKCNTNIECNNNCLGGRWTTVPDGDSGRDIFACDPTTPNPLQWYLGFCFAPRGRGIQSTAFVAAACNEVNSTYCGGSQCVLSGLRSQDAETESKWTEACKKVGGGRSSIRQSKDEATAKSAAQCES